jgi:probable HAF family extracellular repeat protein
MRLWSFVSALALSCAFATATAQTYTVTELGLLPNYPYAFANPTAINDAGQVTGYDVSYFVGPPGVPIPEAFLYSDGEMTAIAGEYSNGYGITGDRRENAGYGDEERRKLRVVGSARFSQSTPPHAFLYEDHLLRDLGTLPGGSESGANAINSLGEIVGSSYNADGITEAFLYRHGNMMSLGYLPGGTGSSAAGINNQGDIVGSVYMPELINQAFLYHDGKMISLGTLPGATGSDATAVNDAGEIVGRSYSSNFQFEHAFLWRKGKMIDLGVLFNGSISEANGINKWGQVVGSSGPIFSSTGNSGAAFLYSDGKLRNLNDMIPANSGWVLLDAAAINNRGQIVGTGLLNGEGAAFLLSPDCRDSRNKDCDYCRHER